MIAYMLGRLDVPVFDDKNVLSGQKLLKYTSCQLEQYFPFTNAFIVNIF